MKRVLTEGSDWPVIAQDEKIRVSDFTVAMERGNHKGAENQPTLLRSLVEKDVVHGYALPLPIERLHHLKRGLHGTPKYPGTEHNQ